MDDDSNAYSSRVELVLRYAFPRHPNSRSKDFRHAKFSRTEFGDCLDPASSGAGDGDGIEVR